MQEADIPVAIRVKNELARFIPTVAYVPKEGVLVYLVESVVCVRQYLAEANSIHAAGAGSIRVSTLVNPWVICCSRGARICIMRGFFVRLSEKFVGYRGFLN